MFTHTPVVYVQTGLFAYNMAACIQTPNLNIDVFVYNHLLTYIQTGNIYHDWFVFLQTGNIHTNW